MDENKLKDLVEKEVGGAAWTIGFFTVAFTLVCVLGMAWGNNSTFKDELGTAQVIQKQMNRDFAAYNKEMEKMRLGFRSMSGELKNKSDITNRKLSKIIRYFELQNPEASALIQLEKMIEELR